LKQLVGGKAFSHNENSNSLRENQMLLLSKIWIKYYQIRILYFSISSSYLQKIFPEKMENKILLISKLFFFYGKLKSSVRFYFIPYFSIINENYVSDENLRNNIAAQVLVFLHSEAKFSVVLKRRKIL
jgi:hypothetical protein